MIRSTYSALRRTHLHLAGFAVTLGLLLGAFGVQAPAHGATIDGGAGEPVSGHSKKAVSPGVRGKALAAARSRAGSPYVYGGAGPRSFDCSGLTMWSYARAGRRLPHSSRAQVGRTVRVKRPLPGDLVFFYGGSGIYHVGIYAGGWTVWHASRPGVPVSRAKIWTKSVFFGRVK